MIKCYILQDQVVVPSLTFQPSPGTVFRLIRAQASLVNGDTATTSNFNLQINSGDMAMYIWGTSLEANMLYSLSYDDSSNTYFNSASTNGGTPYNSVIITEYDTLVLVPPTPNSISNGLFRFVFEEIGV
ncbi:MAG: hypothetical protein QXU18_10960 [Thermoplasmatales archaeon]